ncbi:MAG: molybdopterin adenylyltransferase [Burkholderiaceae bacterium]
MFDRITIGLVSVSDRATAGQYTDQGLPELKKWLQSALLNPLDLVERLLPDEQPLIEETLIELADRRVCDLVLTTGGTGPALRDVTPDAMAAVADRLMPGFGEQMRQISMAFVPTAILSRQIGAIRGKTLMLSLPGQPKAIAQTLQGLPTVPGIFAAVPYCIDLLGGPYLKTNQTIVDAFRPASAIRPDKETA